MSTKKKVYTDKDARLDLKTLRESCNEGLTGEWDCSTEEGREGFEAMIESIDKIAKHYGFKL